MVDRAEDVRDGVVLVREVGLELVFGVDEKDVIVLEVDELDPVIELLSLRPNRCCTSRGAMEDLVA